MNPLGGFLQNQAQMLGIERFGNEIIRPGFHRFHRALDAAMGGNHDYRQITPAFSDFGKDLDAVHPRHLIIEQQNVRRPGFEAVQSTGTIRRPIRDITQIVQFLFQQVKIQRFVVDEKNS